MALPITIPNTFANATTSIPLSQLDNNFSTVVVAINGIGNGAEALANVNITGGTIANVNLSTSNVNITGGNVNITTLNATTVDATNVEVTNLKARDGTAAVTIANTTGILSLSNVLVTVAGSNAAPAITTTGDTNTGIFFPAADTIAFAEGGVEAMRIDSSGNVGIGTSNPNCPLTVVCNSGAEGIFLLGRASDDISVMRFKNNANSTEYVRLDARSSDFLINAVANIPMSFLTNSTERMRITSTGRLGLNTTTPATQFQVNSLTEWGVNLRAASNTDTFRCMFLTQRAKGSLASPTVPISGTIIGGLEAGAYNGTDYTFGFNGGAAIQMQAEGTWTTTSCPSNITFWTNPSGGAGYVQRMIIQADGSIGFKTGSSFTSHFFTYNENGGEINLCDETGTIGTLLDQSNNNTRLLELINGSNMFIGTGASNTTGVLQLATANTERMRITANGTVGIGITNPGAKLEVFDTADVATRIHKSGVAQWNIGVDTIAFAQTDSPMTFRISGTECMRITSGGDVLINATGTSPFFDGRLNSFSANLPGVCGKTSGGASMPALVSWNTSTSGNNVFVEFGTETVGTSRGTIDYNRGAGQVRYNTTSDATLKNIIGDSDGQNSVDILKSTRIREYAWKNDVEQKPQIGVIAQELYETYKGAVSVGGDIEKTDDEGNVTTEYKPWGVDKTAFTFHLIAGWQAHEKLIQEQQAIINDLQTRITQLEGK